MEDRVAELEIRLTHQEAAIEELNNVLVEQQRTIDRLTQHVEFLQQRIHELRPSNLAPPSEETPPPHY